MALCIIYFFYVNNLEYVTFHWLSDLSITSGTCQLYIYEKQVGWKIVPN